ncbi:MAG: glycosyltransferase family 9 protein [Pseudomonadota bacterium]
MKILVIQFKKIGDDIVTSALCNNLRSCFPDAQIDYCLKEHSAELFEHHACINEVIPVSRAELKKPLQYLRKAWRVSRKRYDIIIDANASGKGVLFSFLSPGSKHRISRRKGVLGNLFYSDRVLWEYPPGDELHPVVDFLSPLHEDQSIGAKTPPISLSVSDRERQDMREIMTQCGVDFDRPVFAISASAKDPAKSWHQEKMVTLAKHCLDQYGAQLVAFSGMPHEQQQIREFHQAVGVNSDVFSNVPTRKLSSLMALLSNCDLFLGNAAGARWIAQGIGLPSVAVVYPGDRRVDCLPMGDRLHKMVRWQDCSDEANVADVTTVDKQNDWAELYDRIQPQHVIPVLDQLVKIHVTKGACQTAAKPSGYRSEITGCHP